MANDLKSDKRRDELARRILKTPPQPRDAMKGDKPNPLKSKSLAKRKAKKPPR